MVSNLLAKLKPALYDWLTICHKTTLAVVGGDMSIPAQIGMLAGTNAHTLPGDWELEDAMGRLFALLCTRNLQIIVRKATACHSTAHMGHKRAHTAHGLKFWCLYCDG